MDDLYLDTIIDRYKHPLHKGWIEDGEIHRTHNPSCGDSFEIAFRFEDEKIVEAKWRGEGCAISTVSIDCFCEWAVGKDRTQVSGLSSQDIHEMTGIETITPAREKCLHIPLTCRSVI